MCMEDVRIGRKTLGGQTTVVSTGATQPVIPSDHARRVIVFCAPVTGSCTYSLNNPAVAGEGIFLAAGDGPVHATVDRWGDLVTKPWHLISSGAGVVCTFFTAALPDK